MSRKAKISRKTKETSISVELNIDGRGKYKIDTGIGFLNHMLEQLSKHSSIDLNVKAKGDTHIDLHHTTEDTGIAIGECLKKASKKFIGIKRYAHAMIPMDETLTRVAVELAKDWRTDKYLRRLEALMAIGDKEKSFIISGTGDVLEPEDNVIGIGSGGNYALAAAKVLMETNMSAEEVARKSIKVASDICVYTNNNVKIEKI